MSKASRRSLLAGLSVAPVALMPSVPAISGINPDAELFALVEHWYAHAVRLNAARDLMFETQRLCQYPGISEAMFQQERDIDLFLYARGSRYQLGPRYWYPPRFEAHRYLRDLASSKPTGPDERPGPDGLAFEIERRARAQEIIDAIKEYEAEKGRAKQVCGLDVAEAETARLEAENATLRQQIIELPAKTIGGVLQKTRMLAWIYSEPDGFEDFSEIVSEYAADGANDQTIGLSLARDLLRLTKGGAHVA